VAVPVLPIAACTIPAQAFGAVEASVYAFGPAANVNGGRLSVEPAVVGAGTCPVANAAEIPMRHSSFIFVLFMGSFPLPGIRNDLPSPSGEYRFQLVEDFIDPKGYTTADKAQLCEKKH